VIYLSRVEEICKRAMDVDDPDYNGFNAQELLILAEGAKALATLARQIYDQPPVVLKDLELTIDFRQEHGGEK